MGQQDYWVKRRCFFPYRHYTLMKASAGVGLAYLLTFLQGMLFFPESVYLLLKVWHPQLFSQCKMFENVIMNVFDKTEIFILLMQ